MPKGSSVGLHHPLPLDHAPALWALIGELRRQPLENGALRLLDLQEKRLAVAIEEQSDDADRADRADAHRLEGDVGQPVAVEQNGPIRSERFPIKCEAACKIDLSAKRLAADVEDRRRLVGDPRLLAFHETGKVVVPVETEGSGASDNG
jgi:hypothetical protein